MQNQSKRENTFDTQLNTAQYETGVLLDTSGRKTNHEKLPLTVFSLFWFYSASVHPFSCCFLKKQTQTK